MLAQFSDQIADAVAAAAPSVVQVQGGGRTASGLVFADDVVLTTMRVVGREDKANVRRHDGTTLEGQLAAFDPATRVALIKVPNLGLAPVNPGQREVRVGEIGIAVARSWSNQVTASAGLVSVIGGPLPTGRRRAIERVFRTSAPMHEGFAGGAFLDAAGQLIGVATAASIRGLGVVIPAAIAWDSARRALQQGPARRGYLGIGAQSVSVSGIQAERAGTDRAILVVALKPGSPAEKAGILVGDIVTAFDGQPLTAPDDLLELLGNRAGGTVDLKILRADSPLTVNVTIAERV